MFTHPRNLFILQEYVQLAVGATGCTAVWVPAATIQPGRYLQQCRTALLVTVQEHSTGYCRCREAVQLFGFLLPPYSLVGTCNSAELYFS
jgi:hypothetical protein